MLPILSIYSTTGMAKVGLCTVPRREGSGCIAGVGGYRSTTVGAHGQLRIGERTGSAKRAIEHHRVNISEGRKPNFDLCSDSFVPNVKLFAISVDPNAHFRRKLFCIIFMWSDLLVAFFAYRADKLYSFSCRLGCDVIPIRPAPWIIYYGTCFSDFVDEILGNLGVLGCIGSNDWFVLLL